MAPSPSTSAQRRPGREPRRHPEQDSQTPGERLGRSTKAGARTPATPAACAHDGLRKQIAQRRPGREPRRHVDAQLPRGRRHLRSTKAGARTPATPARMQDRALGRRRSTKAGARTPATRAASFPRRPTRAPLNEGRGANPGDTRRAKLVMDLQGCAQRRPGREPRRHLIASRSTPASASGAQRRPGREPRRHLQEASGQMRRVGDRSTKAGARTPATRGSAASTASRRRRAQRRPGREPRRHATRHARKRWTAALNEGRGANPGDTSTSWIGPCSSGCAQRRPGREPRRHVPTAPSPAAMKFCAQRRPGREPRRHVRLGEPRATGVVRSTKAGARTPATPGRRRRRRGG